MIKVYPIKIEAADDDNNIAFSMECFDEMAATLDVKMLISNDNVEDFISALRESVRLLTIK